MDARPKPGLILLCGQPGKAVSSARRAWLRYLFGIPMNKFHIRPDAASLIYSEDEYKSAITGNGYGCNHSRSKYANS